MFLSARGGLEEVVTHLEKSLSSSINMMKNTEISGVTHKGERYVVHLHNGTKLYADAMVIATPAHVAARLLPDKSISELLQTIPYASVMNVVLAYRAQDVGISLEASYRRPSATRLHLVVLQMGTYSSRRSHSVTSLRGQIWPRE